MPKFLPRVRMLQGSKSSDMRKRQASASEAGTLSSRSNSLRTGAICDSSDKAMCTALIWTPPGLASEVCIWRSRIWLQSYIRPVVQTRCLLALMEFAGEGLISYASSKDKRRARLVSPRSDLFRHHARFNLRNLGRSTLSSCIEFRLYSSAPERLPARLVMPPVGEQRPDGARHLVGQGDDDGVERASCQ